MKVGESDPPQDDRNITPEYKKKTEAIYRKLLSEKLPKQYSKYSGNIDINGKEIKNPTQFDAVRTMIQYLNRNWWDSSNVYRPEHAHTSINYIKPNLTVS